MFGSPTLPLPGSSGLPGSSPLPAPGAPAGRAPFEPAGREGNYFDKLAGPLPPPTAGAAPINRPMTGAGAAPPPNFAGPSEFTRVVSAVQRPVGPPSPAPPPIRPPVAKKGSDRALIIGLIAVVVLAIAFVVVVLVVG